MIKLAIVGARLKNGLDKTFTYDKFEEHMTEYIQQMGFDMSKLTVISGGAQGVDTYAEKWAKRHGVPIVVLKPDWKNKGKRAGLERNADIKTLDKCRELFEKYSALVWYARSNDDDPVSERPRTDVETRYPDEVAEYLDCDDNWQHGFNSGMMAAVSLLWDYLEEPDPEAFEEGLSPQEQYDEQVKRAEEEFPFLDT